ncbi:MAG: hypothetical protein IPL61_36950 [Myxococcales bacterium]|nr:hypothetical protein [Myxococcales bacterium]
MKRLSVIALLAAAIAFTGCKKKDEGNKPATTEAKPAAGTAAPAGGTAAPAAGTATPAAGTAAPAGDTTGTPPADTTGTAPTGAGPSDAEFEKMMGNALAMFGAMGKAVDAAGDDCGKLADGIQKVMDDNKDFIETAKKYKDNPDMDKKAEEWMKGHMSEVMEPMMKVGAAGQKCSSDAKFAEVMKKFEELN